jgi:hypothetical protein
MDEVCACISDLIFQIEENKFVFSEVDNNYQNFWNFSKIVHYFSIIKAFNNFIEHKNEQNLSEKIKNNYKFEG